MMDDATLVPTERYFLQTNDTACGLASCMQYGWLDGADAGLERMSRVVEDLAGSSAFAARRGVTEAMEFDGPRRRAAALVGILVRAVGRDEIVYR